MKLWILLPLLTVAIEAKAAFLIRIPVVDWAKITAEAPVTDSRQFCEFVGTSRRNCIGLVVRANAEYGLKVLLVMPQIMATAFVNSKFNPYDGMPDPITVVAVADGDYPRIMGSAEPIPYPTDLPETDPEIGRKMLYCAAGPVVCAASAGVLMEMGTINRAIGVLKGCAIGSIQACRDFAAAWKKEREYYKKWEEHYREEGYGPAKFQDVYPELINPGMAAAMGGAGSAGGNPGGGGAPVAGGGGIAEPGPLMGTCYGSAVGMGGGPKGPYIEESSVDCYYQ